MTRPRSQAQARAPGRAVSQASWPCFHGRGLWPSRHTRWPPASWSAPRHRVHWSQGLLGYPSTLGVPSAIVRISFCASTQHRLGKGSEVEVLCRESWAKWGPLCLSASLGIGSSNAHSTTPCQEQGISLCLSFHRLKMGTVKIKLSSRGSNEIIHLNI